MIDKNKTQQFYFDRPQRKSLIKEIASKKKGQNLTGLQFYNNQNKINTDRKHLQQ